jgi:hypothetical protein
MSDRGTLARGRDARMPEDALRGVHTIIPQAWPYRGVPF